MALTDKGGLDSLSMRQLGQELGVEAMSLYNHVDSKDDILTGILAMVLDEISLPPRDAHWKAAVRETAISAHDVFLMHPWACGLMLSATRVMPARLRWMDAVLGTLRAAGFSALLTHHAYHALDSHITGFTLWLVNLDLPTDDDNVKDLAQSFMREHSIPQYPHLVEHIELHASPDDLDDVREFEFGLDLILDGIERLRDMG